MFNGSSPGIKAPERSHLSEESRAHHGCTWTVCSVGATGTVQALSRRKHRMARKKGQRSSQQIWGQNLLATGWLCDLRGKSSELAGT